jgi:predicted dehydrogenase
MSIRLAVIGFGSRISHVVKGMCALSSDVRLSAIADPDEQAARGWIKTREVPDDGVAFFPDADALLARAGDFDGILIGTRCFMHTPLAIKALAANLPLFLEKPVAISWDQLRALAAAFKGREDRVVVSFPLRVTPLFETVRQILASGRLGTVNQIQAFNDVPYGGVYFGQWYRNWDEVGGLWLQKATHDFDYINLLAGSRPVSVFAMMTQRVYGGSKPQDLVCSKCDETATCPESPLNLKVRNDGGGMNMEDHACAFGSAIRNQDAGSALIMYEDSVLAAYSQNFIARRSAGRRGARIIGYTATLEFNWFGETIRVMDHHGTRVDEIKVPASGGHGGGDYVLMKSFIDVIRGDGPSVATLADGLQSVAMCLAARDSFHAGAVRQIPAMKQFAASGYSPRKVEA